MRISRRSAARCGSVLFAAAASLSAIPRVHAVPKTWNGANNGLWGTAGNWLPAVLPAAGDYVLIAETNLAMTENVNASVGSVSVENGMTVNQANTVTLSAGSMNIGFDAFSGGGTYNLNGGTVTLAQSLNLGPALGAGGNFTVGGGQLNVGSINIATAGSSTMTLSSGTVNCTGTLSVQALGGLSGMFKFDGGTMSVGTIQILTNGTFESNGAGEFANAPDTELNGGRVTGTFFNVGTFNASSGTISAISNQGVFVAKGNISVATFVNAGIATFNAGQTVTMTAAPGNTSIYAEAGTLTISGTLNTGGSDEVVVDGFDSGAPITIHQTGGNNSVGNLIVGDNPGALTTPNTNYILDANGVINANSIAVASLGRGTFTQASGQVTSPTLYLGNQAGAAGTFLLAGGTLTVNASPGNIAMVVGNAGNGTFIQSGGFVNTNGMDVGGFATSYYRISAGTINNIGSIFIGAGFGTLASATFDQSGGNVTDAAGLFMGGGGSLATATYNLAGGTLNDPTSTVIGNSSFATFNQTAGAHFANVVTLGAGGAGLYNLIGGTLTANTINIAGNGTLNQFGGYLSVGTINLPVAGITHYQFFGGELAVPSLTLADGGLIGGNFSTLPNRSVYVAGTTTLSPFSTLTLNGGTFSTGSINSSGTVIINSGTFQLSNSGLTINAVGPLGDTVALPSGAAINVSGFVTVNSGILDLKGGSVFAASGINNNSQIQLESLLSSLNGATLTNNGTLSGTGRINSVLKNQFNGLTSGLVSVGANDTMEFLNTGNTSSGKIALGGGTVDFSVDLTNTGTISGRGTLQVGTLTNSGTMNFSNGATDVYGTVNNAGTITISGQSVTTFYNNVNTTGGKISVGTNSTAVFFGAVTGSTSFGGAGVKDFEGTLNGPPINSVVGDSYIGTPAIVSTPFFNEDDVQISGQAQVTLDPGSGTVSRMHTLAFLDNGKLDLNNNDLILDYTGASQLLAVRSEIITGRSGGTWQGNQLTSTSAHLASLTPHPTALGYAEASTLGITTFDGQAVDNTAVLVRYTYVGDANLDGKVNALDFNAVATNFGAATSKLWSDGDFNFDGFTNTQDFTAMANNFNLVLASPPVLGSLVPEPGAVALAVGVGAMLVRRRKSGAKLG